MHSGCRPRKHALIVFVLLPLACGFNDLDMHETYATYAEAEADGAVRRGWIPDFVPKSATWLRESHNLDGNTQWLAFRFAPDDRASMEKWLVPATPDELRFHRRDRTRSRPWWPEELLGNSAALKDKYDLYTYKYTIHFGGGPKHYTAYVAIEKGQPRAWYWDPR